MTRPGQESTNESTQGTGDTEPESDESTQDTDEITRNSDEPADDSDETRKQTDEPADDSDETRQQSDEMGQESDHTGRPEDDSSLSQIRPSVLFGRVRETSRYRRPALALSCLVGLVLTTFHWSGIVAGGALVGSLARNLKRAVLYGFGFGILVVAVWAVVLALSVDVTKVIAMEELALLPVGIALGLAILGSCLRGVLE